jgi:hypothetical protein
MKKYFERKAAILRVFMMEKHFDAVKNAMTKDPQALKKDAQICKRLEILKKYYDGVWIRDYERDERGEFPGWLKRGVLSQDGVYDLLCSVSSLQNADGEEK